MSTEVYSPHMEATVRAQLQQEGALELARLLAYFRQRGGPGLVLVEAELRERAQRHPLNYPPQAA